MLNQDLLKAYALKVHPDMHRMLCREIHGLKNHENWRYDVNTDHTKDELRIESYVSELEGYKPIRVVEVYYRNYEGVNPQTKQGNWKKHSSELFSIDQYELAVEVFIYRRFHTANEITFLGQLHHEIYEPL